MVGYEDVLETVAENPGIEIGDLKEIVEDQSGEPGLSVDLLDQAVESGDVVETNERYWIVRKGKYAFDEYDHETT